MPSLKDHQNARFAHLWQHLESDAEWVRNEAMDLRDQCLFNEDTEGGLNASLILSYAYWHIMDYERGLKVVKEALKLARDTFENDYLSQIYHLHALHYWGQSKYYSAKQFWVKAYERAILLKEIDIEIESLIGLGNVWRILNQLDAARAAHSHAVHVAQVRNYPILEAKALILLAWDMKLSAMYDEMLPILERAETVLVGKFDPTWVAEIHDFRGMAYLGLGALEKAERSCQHAYQLALSHKQTWMEAHCCISIARITIAKNELDQALEWLNHAEVAAHQFDSGELLSQISQEQAKVAEQNQDHELALKAFKKYRYFAEKRRREKSLNSAKEREGKTPYQLDERILYMIAQREADVGDARVVSIIQPNNLSGQLIGRMQWRALRETKVQSPLPGDCFIQFSFLNLPP